MGNSSQPSEEDFAFDLHEATLFFDKLVELVPPKFYFPLEPVDSDKWKFKHSKNAKAAAKQTAKENSKKAKRARLDPDRFQTSLDVQRRKAEEEATAKSKANVNGKTDDAHAAPEHLRNNTQGGGGVRDRASSHEELQARLQRRLGELRNRRNAEVLHEAAGKAREWRRGKAEAASAKLAAAQQQRTPAGQPPGGEKAGGGGGGGAAGSNKKATPAQGGGKGASTGLVFGRVEMGIQPKAVGEKRSRKESKEELLAKAKALHSDLKDAAATGADPAAKEKLSQHAWSSALSRATGEKILDNPTLLKRSIKRDEKHKERSQKQWAERKSREEGARSAKQQKRTDNLQQRQQAKLERAIAKREKKLLRPGFEGRKVGFINE